MEEKKRLQTLYNSKSLNHKKNTFLELKYKASSFYGIPRYSQIIYTFLSLVAVFAFALWWFQPSHIPDNFLGPNRIFDILLFFSVSFIIWHPILMDVLTWAISSHIKDSKKEKPVAGLRVAFITTIVPGAESVELLHKCLPAMVKAHYEHDTWLLDEGNNDEVKNVCEQYGVLHFSRKGLSEFNTVKGKFTRTKGGNHNSWYEVYGNYYDVVAQVDTDFVPKSTFLTKTLGYFRDPYVAFVGTPQIYGNRDTSIIARGAAEQLYTFYGSVLKGLSNMGMTLMIGANHVVRVSALKSVNHYSAHITEDLITGMKLHAKGWKSVYISEPLAIGEGPSTWEAFFSQQMRWAYGCMDIFLTQSPRLFWKMGFRQSVYYFFLQQHYFSGVAMALSTLLLSLYFFAGLRAADVDPLRFFVSYSFIILIMWLMSIWLQRFNVHRENGGELLIAGKILSIAAWPVWFLAFVSIILRKRLSYKVTPKGEGEKARQSLLTFIPHFSFGIISVIGLISSYFTHRTNIGMIFWAFCSIIAMFGVPFAQEISDTANHLYIKVINIYERISNPKSLISHFSAYQLFPDKAFNKKKEFSLNTTLRDCIFLSLVTFISSSIYITKIGFYSDDWSFLGNFALSKDQSLWGLFMTATTPNTMMRPLQNIYDAALYYFFHLNPLGYHLVNSVVLVLLTICGYLVLKQILSSRLMALTIPLVYIFLPNYSTDRFWFAVHQANFSMLLYFFSLYATLKTMTLIGSRKTLWRSISIFSLALSALSYEVVIPLYLISIILILKPFAHINKNRIKALAPNPGVFTLVLCVVLFYTALFKAVTTQRLGDNITLNYILYVIKEAFAVNYGFWIGSLPQIWGKVLALHSTPSILILSVILYFLLFLYLHYVGFEKESVLPDSMWFRNAALISIPIFILGYSIFFTNNQLGFSPTGIENRVAIAAAIGVAITLVGMCGWILRTFLPHNFAKLFFCIAIAVICTGNFLVINAISQNWIDASTKGVHVTKAITENFTNFPKGSTLLVDGLCPYSGPAPIFEASWDLKGALQTYYKDPTLQADIVTPRIELTQKEIKSTIYTFTVTYKYKNLYVFNYNTKTLYSLPTFSDAQAYFDKFNPDLNSNCPNSEAGKGVPIF